VERSELPLMTLPRVYPILDTAALERRGIGPAAAAEALLEGGAGILQFRHKGHWSRGMFEEARQVAALCTRAGVPFVVNDRADFAAVLGAGLHLGQDDLPPAAARRVVGPNAFVGFSTHHADQLRAACAEPVDYLALGPIFTTASKSNPDPVLGAAALGGCRALAGKPLVAIGGITLENARAVLEAGADSVAVIAGLLPENATPHSLRQRMEEWQRLVRTSTPV
jgi:thiamine-phosphate pyrophosphorylase